MEYKNFGRTGVKVSPITLGTMNFGGRTGKEEALNILNRAVDAGINLIDTANVYGHDPLDFSKGRGRSEEIIGEFLAEFPKRDDLFIATKMFFPMSDDPNAMGSSRKNIIRECENSLRRLKTDHIDLYQLHHPSNEIPIDESLRALDDLIKAGKIRYVGTSSFPAWQIMESLWVSQEQGLNRFVSEQPVYNLLDRRIERELLPMTRTYGIAVINWSPLAGGFLTGKYKRGKKVPQTSRFNTLWKGEEERLQTDREYSVLQVLEDLAQEKSCDPAQIALNWTMNQPGITSSIIGPRTIDHLVSSLKAVELKLSKEDLARIDEVSPPGDMIVPYYGPDGFAWSGWDAHKYR